MSCRARIHSYSETGALRALWSAPALAGGRPRSGAAGTPTAGAHSRAPANPETPNPWPPWWRRALCRLGWHAWEILTINGAQFWNCRACDHTERRRLQAPGAAS